MVVAGAGSIALARRWIRRRLTGVPDGLGLEPTEVFVYLLATGLIVYTMAVSCGVHPGEARYRTPVDLLVLALSFLGLRIAGRWARAQLH